MEDSTIKVRAYLTLEVLFASRRFDTDSSRLAANRTLKYLLDNSEIIQNMTYEQGEEQERVRVDAKDEMKVVASIQALTQVILNVATTSQANADHTFNFIAAAISTLSEYFFNSTVKIQSAATTALKLIISHGVSKVAITPDQYTQGSGFSKVCMNIKYLLSSRFTDQVADNNGALACSLEVVKSFAERAQLDADALGELLLLVVQVKSNKKSYMTWTSCIGAFMGRMGAAKFFAILPLRLIEFDLNSLSYAHDSRSFLIPLIAHNLKEGANLDFFVHYFLPMILQIDKLREMEQQSNGSLIKVKKYETLLTQLWQLLPLFCQSNSPQMSDCFAELLKYLEPILNKNLLNLRPTALKTFSNLIGHCRHTSVVDNEIKKTRKGLQNIALDYIQGLLTLYIAESSEQDDLQMKDEEKPAALQGNLHQETTILKTLSDFASIAKTGKLSNLFLQSFAELVQLKDSFGAGPLSAQDTDKLHKRLDVLIAILEEVKLNKQNQIIMMQGIKSFIADSKTKKKAYKLLARLVEKYELENGISELVSIHQEITPLVEGTATKPRLILIKAYVQHIKTFLDENKECPLEQVGSLLKHYIIELINAITNSNLKIRSLAQDIFSEICTLMRCKFNAVNQLFTIILVGLAGNKPQTQSNTIRSLIFTIKKNVHFHGQAADPADNLIEVSDAGFQDFLAKTCKIVGIFLKDRTLTNELARSILQFLKIASSLMDVDRVKSQDGLAKQVVDSLFSQKSNPHVKKHKLVVRKILSRLIKRCGVAFMTKLVPEHHRKIITYIEKQKRKQLNKKEKEKLLALMGDENADALKEEGEESDLSSDEDQNEIGGDPEDVDSEDDGSDLEQAPRQRGVDALQANAADIPLGSDIPVVSKLAKKTEKERMQELDGQQQVEMKKQKRQSLVNKVMEDDDD